MMQRLRGVAIVAMLLAASASARAQDGDADALARAGDVFDAAEQHYANGEYALALNGFREVYELMSTAHHPNAPVVLYNVARCYVRLDRAREAIAAYEQFLADAPAGAPNVDLARTELRELRARVSLDRPVPAGGGMSPIGPIVTGVGAAAVLASIVTGALALVADADASAGCADGHCPAALGPKADEAQLLANVTDGLLFGGLAVAATGVVLMFVLPGEPAEAPVSAGCSGSGCGVVVRGRF